MRRLLLLMFSVLFFSVSVVYSGGGVAYSAVTNRYVALILDASGSMSGTAASVQKEAAKSFCQKLLEAEGNNYAAIVKLDSTASVVCDFTNNLTSLDSCINAFTAYGGTNTNDALEKAGELLDGVNVTGAIKNIVICSDGLPEAGNTSNTGHYTYSDHSYSYRYANVAYDTATNLKKSYKIFALGFFHSLSGTSLEFGKRFMRDIASDNSYYEITKVEDLVITFGEVADDVITSDTNPIIIIPGIMGSRLFTSATVFDDSTRVWDPVVSPKGITQLNEQMNVNNTLYVRPCENQNLSKDQSTLGNSVDTYGREYGATEAYKILVDRLCDVFSADKGNYRPIYFFSYDWRKSNAESAASLDKCIESILDETGAEKVNLVCHSMGGLVASKYYVEYGSKQQVEDIITCGTPYEGAPKLINSVMNWDILGNEDNLQDYLKFIQRVRERRYISAIGALPSWEEIKSDLSDVVLGLFGGMKTKLKASFMGVTELLPTENYVSATAMRKDKWTSPFTWKTYQLTFAEYQDICRDVFSGYDAAYLFQNSLKDSGYNKLLQYDKSYFVLGVNQKTIAAIKYKLTNNDIGEKYYEEEDFAYNTTGDGTVPYYSLSISEQLDKLDNNRVFRYATNHGGVVEEDECLEWILAKLNHTTATVSGDELRSTPFIVVRIACPVDVTINSGNGSLSSSLESLSTSAPFGRLDVLGGSDDIKLLCLDNSSDIAILMNGTDEGTMSYAIRFFDDEGVIYKEDTFEDVSVTKDTVIQTDTDGSKPTVLKIDHDGDGTFDDYIMPSSSVGEFSVTSQPTDQYVETGKSATFKVSTSAANPTYQWYINYDDGNGWKPVNEATSAEYTIPQAALTDNGNQYSCLIANEKGHTVSSNAAVLHVSATSDTQQDSSDTDTHSDTDTPLQGTPSTSGGCDSLTLTGISLAFILAFSGKSTRRRK